MEITDAEHKREKRLKRNQESLREFWDNVKRTNICIIGVPEEERQKGTEKIFQEIIAENFPNMGKETHSDSGRAENLICDKLKEEHTKTYFNQTDKN